MTVAALFVARGGCYFDPSLTDVDPWDETRDARLYAGPWPVVAHPPCSRWCLLAGLVQATRGHKVGDDGGTFAAALASVRRWGGVLEHPAFTRAWPTYGLPAPPLPLQPSGTYCCPWPGVLLGRSRCPSSRSRSARTPERRRGVRHQPQRPRSRAASPHQVPADLGPVGVLRAQPCWLAGLHPADLGNLPHLT